ncbi:hypothetical protein DYBT9275_03618 [Dyadobacter sp. CECT 9275]|uniref:FAD dependent oxidoreductase n=1 Tax=Dyadobacter helix TaxID=2822344 RepID=A0A916JEF2_9BACT|nr:FAD-dependent oxidoreductase [Dyadobacter sp. CECT 9275]CAG5005626.1 hypothetical protein DYBT9275_03618 [Dyadobacter sp. CECT 9275]
MKCSRFLYLVFILLLQVSSLQADHRNIQGNVNQPEYDLVVYGATASGIIAGITAAREGAKVIIIEPGKFIGGVVTGGLSKTDIGNQATIGGITREFFTRASQHYNGKYMWIAEPHINSKIFEEMLAEVKIDVIRQEKIRSVNKKDGRITGFTTLSGKRYQGKMFIDATYEGDLMAAAKVSYVVGRESKGTYQEEYAGFYPDVIRNLTNDVMLEGYPGVGGEGPGFVHGTPTKISGLHKDGTLVDGVTRSAAIPGSGDNLTQSYTFRLAVTNNKDNLLPWPKPAQYDPRKYELLLRLVQAYPGIPFVRLVNLSQIANDKYDLNAQGFFSTDYVGGNTDYPDGDYDTRDRIWQDHEDYVKGFFWFLAHDERIPAKLGAETRAWGLCKDEFVDNHNWPYQLYVREARRMVGEYVMNQMDCQENILKKDVIAMGSFIMDSHIVQRIIQPDGSALVEGAWDVLARAYKIPYRSIIPKRQDCLNLLVPVCMSASHVAYGSIRMEPVYMMMGQAAGLAAVHANQEKAAVQDVDVNKLQEKLKAQKQILSLVK